MKNTPFGVLHVTISYYNFVPIMKSTKNMETINKTPETYFENLNYYYTLASSYFAIEDYENPYLLVKSISEKYPDDGKAQYYFSFYSLYVNDKASAISAAKKALLINPDLTKSYQTLALGYLMNDEKEKAFEIYEQWINKKFPHDTRPAKELFVEDIVGIEASGIKNKNFEEIKKYLIATS